MTDDDQGVYRYMKTGIEEAYKEILRYELVPAFGCTEPGAVAYASSKARNLLGDFPEHIDITCSGNIIKNVKGVVVPNSGGMHGIDAATILGAAIQCDSGELEILSLATEEDRKLTAGLVGTGFCVCHLEQDEGNVYIRVVAKKGGDEAEVVIKDRHTNIIYMRKNDEVIMDAGSDHDESDIDGMKKLLNVKDIIEFADSADYSDVYDLLKDQIKFNEQVAKEGIRNEYGAAVGRTILQIDGDGIKNRAKAYAAAASDARMGGCSLPVVVNSCSGNQGITTSVPVAEYAAELGVSEDRMYRALILSNLIAVHIKRHIGVLSAFCGAVSAGCASGAAVTYMCGGTYDQICATIINTLGNVGGVVCDGAKASCAAKIASSVDAAIMAHEMAMKGKRFAGGEGIVADDVEKTIENVGTVGREGMRETDITILNLMLEDENRIN